MESISLVYFWFWDTMACGEVDLFCFACFEDRPEGRGAGESALQRGRFAFDLKSNG